MERPAGVSAVNFDGVATCPPLPEVAEAMRPWLSERHANPESRHAAGAAARRAVEEARADVAALVGAKPEEVVFTSGATEANNLAVRGAAAWLRRAGDSGVAVPAHEHPSLLHPARTLAREGFTVAEIAVGRDGLLPPAAVPGLPRGLLAFSHAHAELGTLQPAAELAAAARASGTRVLVDATLTAGRIPCTVETLGGPDLLTLSFHHFGGPMGVGALLIRGGLPIAPLLEGGAQERGYRPGTPNLPGIVGAGVAARIARGTLAEREAALRRAAADLREGLQGIDGLHFTGPPPESRLPGHVSFTVERIEGESLLLRIEAEGVLAATGSPCADVAGFASAALLAAGYTRNEARGHLVSCAPPHPAPSSAATREAAAAVQRVVGALRALAPGAETPGR
jgi:cysteine desulfurase